MDVIARPFDRSRLGPILPALFAAALLLSIPDALASGPFSTQVQVDDEGFHSTVKRPGYRLDLELEGRATFTADESDIATMTPGGTFEITEKRLGVSQQYRVESDARGVLVRRYERDGDAAPLEAAARAWVKSTLLTAFRTTGLDAEARAPRLLARGSGALLDEIAAIDSDGVRATYLGVAFAAPALDAGALARAIDLAGGISSDFELRRALAAALDRADFPADRMADVLEAARDIGSDFELATLLVKVAPRLPADARTVAAWRAAVEGVGSDYEMRRALSAAFERAPAAYRAAGLAAAAELGSDFEMRSVLEVAASRLGGDAALLDAYLDRVEDMGSDFEQRQALTAVARQVASTPAKPRYLAIARTLGDHERGEALTALVDADGI